jgi:hypothetical protein
MYGIASDFRMARFALTETYLVRVEQTNTSSRRRGGESSSNGRRNHHHHDRHCPSPFVAFAALNLIHGGPVSVVPTMMMISSRCMPKETIRGTQYHIAILLHSRISIQY